MRFSDILWQIGISHIKRLEHGNLFFDAGEWQSASRPEVGINFVITFLLYEVSHLG